MEESVVMAMRDSPPRDGIEKSKVTSGMDSLCGGTECNVKRPLVEAYVAKVRPVDSDASIRGHILSTETHLLEEQRRGRHHPTY